MRFFASFALLLVCCLPVSIRAQNISCLQFNLDSISPNPQVPGQFLVHVHFSAPSDSMVGYPHVQAVLDCNNDTIATGSMFFFAQLGQSTQGYPINLAAPDTLGCYPLRFVFVYGLVPNGDSDTCVFVVDAPSALSIKHREGMRVYPNPVDDLAYLEVDASDVGCAYVVTDVTGKVMFTGSVFSKRCAVDVHFLTPGIYFLRMRDRFQTTVRLLKR